MKEENINGLSPFSNRIFSPRKTLDFVDKPTDIKGWNLLEENDQ